MIPKSGDDLISILKRISQVEELTFFFKYNGEYHYSFIPEIFGVSKLEFWEHDKH